MPPTSLEFPFHFAEVESLERLFFPIVKVQLKTRWGWKAFDFLLDTGADVTVLPSFCEELLGINRKNLQKQELFGVGGVRVAAWKTTVPLRIGQEEFPITAWFHADNETPFLLGKKDVFDTRFSLTLDTKRNKTTLMKNYV